MPELKRSLSPFLLVFYGLGTILGAGIYVLTGVVAGKAGIHTPFAFLLAALVASPTAFAYAELSGRHPQSAGEAVYVSAAFRSRALTFIVGLTVAFIGLVSAATIARGFVGYLEVFISLPPSLVIFILVCGLGSLAIYGIVESVTAAVIVTFVEIAGLLIVIGTGVDNVDADTMSASLALPESSIAEWTGIMAGAFLAFYAFIGFEDIVNIAEETRRPERTLPIAILGSLGVATLLYFLTAIVAISSVPLIELAGNEAPIALIVQRNSDVPAWTIVLISMLAVINGALVQMIMASRVVYGMSTMKSLPSWFAMVDPQTRTPLRATILVTGIVLLLALLLDLETLARLTSALTLMVFASINLALLVIKSRREPTIGPSYSFLVPCLGLMTSVTLLVASVAA